MDVRIARRSILKNSLALGSVVVADRLPTRRSSAQAAPAPVVETTNGRLQGQDLGDLLVFRGIPFAKPPIGPLRFRSPEPPEPWTGVRDATTFGPGAPQGASPFEMLLPVLVPETSEDCLYLNVFTPGTLGKRPVMVWIHGGGNVVGAGSQQLYDGTELVRRGDIVIVTLNYRLGIFGFLHGTSVASENFPTSGNEGLLDQVAALRWVQREIAAFGGDPENVTVFGQSAGSMNIAALMGMPSARGLFHKAILQSSGTANHSLPLESAARVFSAILAAAELSPATAGQLGELSGEALLDLQTTVGMVTGGFFPVIDGEVLPRSTYEAIEDGEAAGIPILVGTVRDEFSIFLLPDPGIAALNEARLLTRVEAIAPGRGQEAIDLYRTERLARGENISPPALWIAMMTDHDFFVPAMRFAELQSRNAPVSTYLFTRPSPIMGGAFGSLHGLDLPFVWGLNNELGPAALVGDKAAAAPLSAAIQDAWLAFSRIADPSSAGVDDWPGYDPGERATMILDVEPKVMNAPREAERRFWEAL